MAKVKKKHKLAPDELKKVVYRVCELFFGSEPEADEKDETNRELPTVSQIADQINKELKLHLTREQIYPLMAQAKKFGFVHLVPPLEQAMASKVAAKFKLPEDRIRVVNVTDRSGGEHVAEVAARWVMDLMKEVAGNSKRPVGLGLGPGRATLEFSRHLSKFLQEDPRIVKLIAITAGFPPKWPRFAPESFFNLFPAELVDEYVGLPAEPMVTADEFDTITGHPLIKEALDAKESVDIVVSAMGDINDKHDLFGELLKAAGEDLEKLKAKGWLGNFQYRPYTATKAVEEKGNEMRAVTLFELNEFKDLAKTKDKHVVLIARQCGICGMSRAAALCPLLCNKELKVWSELVMDLHTARELMEQP